MIDERFPVSIFKPISPSSSVLEMYLHTRNRICERGGRGGGRSLSEKNEEGCKVGSTVKGKYNRDGEPSGRGNEMSRGKGVEYVYVVYFLHSSALFPA